MVCLQAGRLRLRVSLDGFDISRGGLYFDIQAAAMSAADTSITGADIYGCIAGNDCSLLLTSRDRFGNARSSLTDGFTATNSNATVLVVRALGAGVYRVRGT